MRNNGGPTTADLDRQATAVVGACRTVGALQDPALNQALEPLWTEITKLVLMIGVMHSREKRRHELSEVCRCGGTKAAEAHYCGQCSPL